jgi:hypothetical protein
MERISDIVDGHAAQPWNKGKLVGSKSASALPKPSMTSTAAWKPQNVSGNSSKRSGWCQWMQRSG